MSTRFALLFALVVATAVSCFAPPVPVGFFAPRAASPCTAPPAPASLSIPGHNLTPAGEMPLTWSASAGATGYKIYRSTTAGSGYTLIGTSSVTTYTNAFPDAPASCVTYYYIVTATNAGCESAASNEASGYNVAPPTGVMGGGSGSDAVLSWDTPPACNNIVSIRRSTLSGGPYDEIGTAGAADTTFTDVQPGSGSFFYVIVFNTPVHQSEISSEVQVDL